MKLPVEYTAARRALAACLRPKEAKTLLHQAETLESYAFKAKDPELISFAAEMRKRAEREVGRLITELPKARPPGGSKKHPRRDRDSGNPDRPKTLAEQGVDKNLAERGRKAWRMPEDQFERLVAKVVKIAVASVENFEAVIKEARAEAIKAKLENRGKRHEEIRQAALLTTSNAALIAACQFPLIYADPPWFFKTYTPLGGARAPDNHYPTLSDEEIINFAIDGKPIREIAHADAALFLWCTSSNLPLALNVMGAWGFAFKASAVWKKDKQGTGQVFRNWHEVLLYGSRGDMPGPLHLPPSVFEYPRGAHSEKPPEIRAAIEQMYPHFDQASRLELFARGPVEGWTVHGFEAGQVAA